MYEPVDYPEIICRNCGNLFKPGRKDATFCSKKCKSHDYFQKYYKKNRKEILKKNRQWAKDNPSYQKGYQAGMKEGYEKGYEKRK